MKLGVIFLMAIMIGNNATAMFFYGLSNRQYQQNRAKQVCKVPEEIKSCINSVELPLNIELMKNLWNSFSNAIPNALPKTFEYQQYNFDQQWAKWVLFVKEYDENFEEHTPLEVLCHWQQEIRKNDFYWLPKQAITRHLMDHLWLEMKNGTVRIGFVLANNKYGPVLEDKEGLLTQFVLSLQVGIVENLWKNKKIIIQDGCVTKVPENYNNLQIDQLFSICGINKHPECKTY